MEKVMEEYVKIRREDLKEVVKRLEKVLHLLRGEETQK